MGNTLPENAANRPVGEKPTSLEPATPTPTEPAPPAQDKQAAGSKDAVLADLASERDRRQAAEQASKTTADKLQAVLAALGLGADGETQDPAKQAETFKQQVAERDRQLAVLRNAPADADAQALLDSRSFLAALANIDPDDPAAVTASIAGFIEANPRFSRTPATNPGARDLAQSTTTQTSADPLAAAISAAVGGRR